MVPLRYAKLSCVWEVRVEQLAIMHAMIYSSVHLSGLVVTQARTQLQEEGGGVLSHKWKF
jgi:hypothetical protein